MFVRSRVDSGPAADGARDGAASDRRDVSRSSAPRLHERPHDGLFSVASAAAPGTGDSVRAVRPYVPGDSARLVHWPTSARRGTLVVREHEPPVVVGVALVVDLNGPPDEVELAASRAAGIGRATLAAGGAVWCCTSEAGGPVSARVVDQRDLGRRLARATAGPGRHSAAGLARRGGARVNDAGAPRRRAAVGARIAVAAGGRAGRDRARRGRAPSRRAAIGFPLAVGALAGAVAALLGVFALPSLSTRRVVVVLLGLGGLGALRHASFSGSDTSPLLVCWAAATLVALLLVDRTGAEQSQPLPRGAPLAAAPARSSA